MEPKNKQVFLTLAIFTLVSLAGCVSDKQQDDSFAPPPIKEYKEGSNNELLFELVNDNGRTVFEVKDNKVAIGRGVETNSRLHVESNSGPAIFGASIANTGVYGYTTGADSYGIFCYAGGSNGKCGGNKAWTSSSDERLKSEIESIADALNKTLSLRGVTYNWISDPDGEREAGVIAQDVVKVLPEIVSTDDNGYYTVQTSQLVSLLIEAMKEQQGIINEQDSRISSLEDRLEQLEFALQTSS